MAWRQGKSYSDDLRARVMAALAAHISAHSDMTLAAMQAWLEAEHGVRLSNGAIWTAVDRLGLTLKKDAPGQRARPSGRCGAPPGLARGAALYRISSVRSLEDDDLRRRPST